MKNLMAVLLSMVVLGCAEMNVKRDYDTSVDFGPLKTYAWEPANQTGVTLMETRCVKSADVLFLEKGYRTAAPDKADFFVACRTLVETENSSGRVHTGIGVGGGSGGVFGGVNLGLGLGQRPARHETLVLEIIDPKSRKVIWQGSARDTLEEETDPKSNTQQVAETVKTILSKFPPKP